MTSKLLLASLLIASFVTATAAPRVLPEGKLPQDTRLQPLKDLDGYFPFNPPRSTDEWSKRAEHVRRQLLVSLGLWPLPTRTPLNPVIHGRIERDGYAVEKVYFESVPGFFVTGNLYRPLGREGKMPGVLCPHGHWADGRFMDQGADLVRREIAQGAERFEEGGRSVLQARCVQLARMGCVVFHWDMLGYADSIQIPMEIAHSFKKQRADMNAPEGWGLFSAPAESWCQSVMGLQTWNSMRALDFLLSLSDVDPDRIACTGASGGGTQTFILAGLDPRVKIAFPAVMVSTAMQGGCTCENACGLRVGTGNIEFAALFAPKPLGMTSADDWTREMSTKGFPELKQIYTLLGAPDQVMLKRGEHFGHNYNHVSRSALYGWVNRQFKLGQREPVLEQDYRRLTRDEMTVWDAQHPKPETGPAFERKLLRWLSDDARQQLEASRESVASWRKAVAPALDVLLDAGRTNADAPVWEMTKKTDQDTWLEMCGLVRDRARGAELPAVFHYPKQWKGRTVLWITGRGKAGLYDQDGSLLPAARKLVDEGATVVGVDLLYQGEFLAAGDRLNETPRVKNTRESAAYTLGYNRPIFVQRVNDVLTLIDYVKTHERPTTDLVVVGLDGAGPVVAAALTQARGAVNHAVVETGGFRFGNVRDIRSPDFLPGGAKYFDLPGMLALAAPTRLLVTGDDTTALELVRWAYEKESAGDRLAVLPAQAGTLDNAALAWLRP